MLTDLMRDKLPLIATEGDNGFLMAADEFEASWDERNQKFALLLRRYVEIQTYVRMSQPIPLDMANEFKALNDYFETPNRQGVYYESLGPFFIGIATSAANLASHLNWLEEQPVRIVRLARVEVNNDFAMILRNHRFQSMKQVMITPDGRVRDVSGMATAIRGMTAHSLMRFTFEWGMNDRLGLVKAAFMGNKTIPTGCEMYYGTTRACIHK